MNKAPTNRTNVVSWMKNVGKSLGYASLTNFKEMIPASLDTIQSAKEPAAAAKEAYKEFMSSGFQGIPHMIFGENADDYVGKVKTALKNIGEDIRTGNINNKARENSVSSSGDGFDDFDVDFNFDDDLDDSSFDEDSGATVISPNVHITTNITKNNPMVKAVNAQTEVDKALAKTTAERDVKLASAQMALTRQLGISINNSMGVLNENIGALIEFNNTNMAKFTSASVAYYESSLSALNTISESLTRLSEPAKSTKRQQRDMFDVSDIFEYGGGFNIEEYIKNVKKNIKRESEYSTVGSLIGMMSGTGMLDSIIANPLGMITEMAVGSLIPEVFKKLVEETDKTLGAFIPALLSKITGYGDSNMGGGLIDGAISSIARILGVRTDKKTILDLSNYEKGAVPFDGVVRKSIVDVIPGYLSKILAAVSGKEPITFDYDKGVFKNANRIRKDFDEEVRNSIVGSFDASYDIRQQIRSYAGGDSKKEKQLNKIFEGAMVKLANTNGVVDYKKIEDLDKIFNTNTSKTDHNIYDTSVDPEVRDFFMGVFNSLSNADKMNMFAGREKYLASQVRSQKLHRLENDQFSTSTVIGSGLYDDLDEKAVKEREYEARHTNDAQLEEVKKLLKAGKPIPAELSNVRLDYEAEKLKRDLEKKRKTKWNLFEDTKNPILKFIAPAINTPINFIGDKLTKFSNTMTDFIFGTENEDGTKKKRRSFADWIKDLSSTIKEKLFGKDGFFTKIKESDWFKGLTEKAKGLRDSIKRYMFGVSGTDDLGLFGGVRDRFKAKGKKAKEYFTGDGGIFDIIKGKGKQAGNYLTDALGIEKPVDENGKPIDTSFTDRTINILSSATDMLAQGFQNFGAAIFGPKGTDGDGNPILNDTNRLATNVLTTIKNNSPATISNAMIGMGAGAFLSATSSGLLSGLVLGPIGGLVAGIGVTLATKSTLVNEILFGKDDKNTGKRIEGLISNRTQQWFKDNKNPLIVGGGIGSVAGLMGFGAIPAMVLGGPISGAILGIGVGMAAKSKDVQEFLFGKPDPDNNGKRIGGLINQITGKLSSDTKIDAKKIIGTLGAGGLAGLGVFGALGLSPMIGAVGGIGAGLAVSSEKWRQLLFGDGSDDEKKQGILGKTINKFTDKNVKPTMLLFRSQLMKTGNLLDVVKEEVTDSFLRTGEMLKAFGRGIYNKLTDPSSNSILVRFLFRPIIGTFGKIANGIGSVARFGIKTALGLGRAAVLAPVKVGAGIIRGASRLVLDDETLADLDEKRAARLAENEEKKRQRKEDLNAFKENLNNTSVLSKFTGDDQKDAERALAEKYGPEYNKKSKAEQETIKREEGSAASINNIDKTAEDVKDINTDILSWIKNIANILTGDNMAVGGDNIGSTLRLRTSDSGDTGTNPDGSVEPNDETSAADMINDGVNTPLKPKKIKADAVSAETNMATASTAEGIKSGLESMGKNPKGPLGMLSSIMPIVKKGLLLLKGKGILIAAGLLFAYRFLKDPIGTLSPLVDLAIKGVKTLLTGFSDYKSVESEQFNDASSNLSGFADSSSANFEKVTTNSNLMGIEKDAFFSQLENNASKLSFGERALSGNWFVDTTSTDKVVKENNAKLKDTAVRLLAAHNNGTITLNEEELAEVIKVGTMSVDETNPTFKDKLAHNTKEFSKYLFTPTAILATANNMGNIIRGNDESEYQDAVNDALPNINGMSFNDIEKYVDSGEMSAEQATQIMLYNELQKKIDAGQITYEQASEAMASYNDLHVGKAIGESNVDENSRYLLHKDEGVLTASANHLFGGSETTAGILNAMARNGTLQSDASALQNMTSAVGGTLSPDMGSQLSNAMFGDTTDTQELEKYLTTVRQDSLTVSDDDYWKYNGKENVKYSGIAKALFKVVRFANYPARLINNTLGEVSDDMAGVGSSATDSSAKSQTQSFGNSIKEKVTGIWGNIKNFFTGGGPVNEPSGSSGKSGIIGIGQSEGYYKFPSASISASDINPNRYISGKHSPHKGLDLLVRDRSNLAIRSTTNGTVVFSGWQNSYGNMVQVQDENGMYHLYAHMSKTVVKEGDIVRIGDQLGVEGTTGDSTGNHLHYEVGAGYNKGGSLTNRVHPAEYLDGYINGRSPITATPIEDYTLGSFWDGTSGSNAISLATLGTSYGYSTAGSSSGQSSAFNLYAPFADFIGGLKTDLNTRLGKTSSSNSSIDYTANPMVNSEYTGEGSDNAEKIWRFLRSNGYSVHATAGILGNLQQESRLDPNAKERLKNGKIGAGRGIAQWSYDGRWNSVVKRAKQLGVSEFSLQPQLETLIAEMEGEDVTTKNILNKKYGGLDNFKKTNNARWAADAFMTSFERAGTPNMDSRYAETDKFFNLYADAIGGGDETVNNFADRFNAIGVKNNGFVTPSLLSSSIGAQILGMLVTVVSHLAKISGNTATTANATTKMEKSLNAVKNEPAKKDTPINPMYDVADKRRSEQSRRSYDIAKAIARGV